MSNGQERDLVFTGSLEEAIRTLREEDVKILVQDEGPWEVVWIRSSDVSELQMKP